ncbi:hypothetical protein Dimus_029363, partial [Dionaea muscipula]
GFVGDFTIDFVVVLLWWLWVAVGAAAGGMEVGRRPLADDRHGLGYSQPMEWFLLAVVSGFGWFSWWFEPAGAVDGS